MEAVAVKVEHSVRHRQTCRAIRSLSCTAVTRTVLPDPRFGQRTFRCVSV